MISLFRSRSHFQLRHFDDQSSSTNQANEKQSTDNTVNNTNANSNSSYIPIPIPIKQPQNNSSSSQQNKQNKTQSTQKNYTYDQLKYEDDTPVDEYFIDKNTNWTKTADGEQVYYQPKYIPWKQISISVGIVLIVILITYTIYTLYKRYKTKKQYNETPQNFAQQPKLSINQYGSLIGHKFQRLSTKQQDLKIQLFNSYGGSIYQFTFINYSDNKNQTAYWNKLLNTDCYFQIEIDNLKSQLQFGYVNKNYIKLFQKGQQKYIGRVGISLNTFGCLKVLGEIKYQFKWHLNFGDVIGLGISHIEGTKRVWITKNGILLNPPTFEQIQKWMNQQNLSNDHKQAFNQIERQLKYANYLKNTNSSNKKQLQLLKKKIIIPQSQKFQFYAIIAGLQSFNKQGDIIDDRQMELGYRSQESNRFTKIKFNVGGKIFRLRDDNMRTGLLANAYQKQPCCGFLCCD